MSKVSTQSIHRWLFKSLNARQLDADVYTDYIIGLLESGEDVLEWLNIINDNDPIGNVELSTQLLKYYRGEEDLVEPPNSEVLQTNSSVDFNSSLLSTPPIVIHDELHIQKMLESAASICVEEDLHKFDFQTEDDDFNDMNSTDVDYTELAFSLEAYFSSYENSGPILFSPDAIYSAIQQSTGDLYYASMLLLHTYQLVLGNQGLNSRPKPCRHLLQSGRCLRSDCVFDHNFATTPCRFWLLAGGCTVGSECVFMHSLSPLESAFYTSSVNGSGSEYRELLGGCGESQAAVAWNDEHLFPSLIQHQSHSQSESIILTHSEATTCPPPPPPLPYIQTSATSHATNSSVLSSVPEQSWAHRVAVNKQQSVVQSDHKLSTSRLSTSKLSIGGSTHARNDCKCKSDCHHECSATISSWVESGGAVSKDYSVHREKARTLAIARNKLLEQATQAYLRGDKVSASELSARGRDLNVEMKQEHVKAAQAIFSLRNSEQAVFGRRQLDMHGLHASEVSECLHALLPEIYTSVGQGRGHQVEVAVVTGSGHHTTGNKGAHNLSRTYNAATSVCDEMGLSYRPIKDPKGYVGGIMIRLTEKCTVTYMR